jgi:hypothetical protein
MNRKIAVRVGNGIIKKGKNLEHAGIMAHAARKYG